MLGAHISGERRRRTVMVVDDEVDIRESLASMLQEEGYEVVTAPNGLDALALLDKGKLPSVMLLDLTMPTLDGHQVLAILRERGLLQKVPVIVVSAVAFRLTHGSVANVPKPINFDSLLELVHQYSA